VSGDLEFTYHLALPIQEEHPQQMVEKLMAQVVIWLEGRALAQTAGARTDEPIDMGRALLLWELAKTFREAPVSIYTDTPLEVLADDARAGAEKAAGVAP